jgi:hypothetical protein
VECAEPIALAREMRNPTAMSLQSKKRASSAASMSGGRMGAPGDFDWIENASAEELQAFLSGEAG